MNAIRQALVGVGLLLGGFSTAETTPQCAKATVSGGASCEKISVSFDLTECKDQTRRSDTVVKCVPGGATAILKTKKHTYEAKIKEGPEAWGAKTWVVESVTTIATNEPKNEPKPEPKAVVAAAPKEPKKPKAPPRREVARTDMGDPRFAKKAPPPPPPVVVAGNSEAAKAPVPPPAPSEPGAPTPASTPTGLQFSALFDGYYSYNFNGPTTLVVPNSTTPGSLSLPGNQNVYRNFDLFHNQVAIGAVQLTAKKTGEVGFRVDLGFGQLIDFCHKSSDGTVDEVVKHLAQALAIYNPSWAPNLTISVGKMWTHIGYELTMAKDNWNYSRSWSFALGLPYWHTGLSVAYAIVPTKFTATGYVYNGWNSLYENNSEKTLGLQLLFTPLDNLTATYNVITGPEQANNNTNRKTVHEANVTYTFSPMVAAGLDFTYGTEKNATLAGGATGDMSFFDFASYVKLQPHPRYYFSPRLEFFNDHNGAATGIEQNLRGLTLTNSFLLAEGLETRIEGRWDHSNQFGAFTKNGSPTNDQVTLGVSLLFSI